MAGQLTARGRARIPSGWVRPLLVVVGLGLLIQLLLSMLLAEGAYKLQDLRIEHQTLETEVEIVAQEVDSLASPQFLADSANRLGMIANPAPIFLDLERGEIFGDPKAAAQGGAIASKNLVANSALGALELSEEAAVASSEVAGASEDAHEVVQLEEIPASPTR